MARPFKTQRDPQATPRRAKTNFTKLATDANAPPEPTQRLHKLLALAGLGSRRDMEALIASGRVTVNGAPATQGQGVTQHDTVRLDSRPVKLPFIAELPQVLIYHKPEGEIVSQDDPEGRASVFDKLPKVKNGKWIAIGRLDMNTSGLLIFTTSGELANRFMHPRYEVEREYAVRIFGELTEGQMTQLKEGIELEDGPANFDSITAQGGEGANHWYQVILREGRNREVRRLFEAFQLPVSRLMRVRFGPVNLPPRVKRGSMLKLEQKEVVGLLEWADLPVPSAPLRQLTQREKLKATTVFTPKVRKQRISALDRPPRVGADGETRPYRAKPDAVAAKKPAPKRPANRRVRQTSDLAAPAMQKKGDRNRGRG
ncbi:MAG: pseudouridine synthase [Methylotenera sp.]|uniref:pseudouridine synthase n=1 Tax=Methylotenera sp. TaxID=2051956 RepID=UPI0024880A09|nr:pseudouridine synthase [Methylotenera sp.]MDI1309964.1 pseudouridine synthase [Methylotenera sp.]